jgi:hypothetical protein
MSFQSSSRLFLLVTVVIFSAIGLGSADVNILVSKGTNINVMQVEDVQGRHTGNKMQLEPARISRVNVHIFAGLLMNISNAEKRARALGLYDADKVF